jgi:hypothetical protein
VYSVREQGPTEAFGKAVVSDSINNINSLQRYVDHVLSSCVLIKSPVKPFLSASFDFRIVVYMLRNSSCTFDSACNYVMKNYLNAGFINLDLRLETFSSTQISLRYCNELIKQIYIQNIYCAADIGVHTIIYHII